MKKRFFTPLTLAAGLAAAPATALAIPVDLELVLAVDVSGSVNAAEYAGQKSGYVAAFNNPGIQNAILSTGDGRLGRIAVTYVEWSSFSSQAQPVGWSLIDSVESASAFASAIDATDRSFGGGTNVWRAMDYSTSLFSFNDPENAEYEGARQVIDISGDGIGGNATESREAALAAGVDMINAIAIQSESVEEYFQEQVIGGEGSFAMFAENFNEDFTTAVGNKILREVSGETPSEVSEPGTMILLGLGLTGLLASRRRKYT